MRYAVLVISLFLSLASFAQEPDASDCIAFMRKGRLLTVDVRTLELREVIGVVTYDRPISWSPDGRSLLYWKHSDIGWDVWRVGFDGGEPTNLTQTKSGGCRMARYSPSGDRIAFMRDLPNGLFVMRRDGKNQRQLSQEGDRDNPPSWSHDGRLLAYSYHERQGKAYTGRIFLVQPDGKKARPLPVPLSSIGGARFSPVDSRIAFYASKDGAPNDLYVSEPDGSALVNLTQTPAVSEREPHWSSDGKRIAYLVPMKVGQHLCVVDLETRKVETLSQGKTIYDMSWAPDGRRLAVIMQDEDKPNLFLVDREGHRRLTKDGAWTCAWRPATAN